jgi:hypothetical protein
VPLATSICNFPLSASMHPRACALPLSPPPSLWSTLYSSSVAACHFRHGPHREHRFALLLQSCMSHSRYLAMTVSLAPQFWLF